MEPNVNGQDHDGQEILCPMCSFSTKNHSNYKAHIVRYHKNDHNFIVTCCINNCPYTTRSWSAFKTHLWRCHQDANNGPGINGDDDQDDDEDGIPGPGIPEMEYDGEKGPMRKLKCIYVQDLL
jgi:hypothetical protein